MKILKSLEENHINILIFLIEHELTTYTEIADELELSSRTVAKYIKEINFYLDSSKAHIQVKPSYGVFLEGDREFVYSKIMKYKNSNRDYKNDRMISVLTRFLNLETNEYLTIEQISKELFYSRSTIDNTIKHLKNTLEKYHGKIVSNYKGMQIILDESSRRSLMSEILDYYLVGIKVIDDSQNRPDLSLDFLENTHEFINLEYVYRISDVLNNFINDSNLRITKYEYQALVIHLYILMKRINKENQDFYNHNLIEYSLSSSTEVLFDYMEKEFNVVIPICEKKYIDTHISLIEANSDEYLNVNKLIKLKYYYSLNQIVINFFQNYNVTEKFKNALIIHLNAAINRIKSNKSIENPYTNDIKISFPRAFQIAVDLTEVLEKEHSIKLNDDEIAYVSLHIESFLKANENHSIEVILICGEGHGTSNLLKQRIKQNFKDQINIKQIVSINNLHRINLKSQFIISTIPINIDKATVVQVSPLLNNIDLENIKKYIINETDRGKSNFVNLLNKNHIFITKEKNETITDVLDSISNKLIDGKYAVNDIKQKIVEREKISSTALGIFSMPHVAPKNIYKPIISIYINKKGIDWNGEEVKIVFFFGINESISDQLSNIYDFFNKIISNDELLNKMIKVKNKSQLIKLIEEL